ncbi:hypothetical protein IWW57_004610, partial [Coemansia sp. S610]
MEARRHQSVQDIDQGSLEQLLVEHLRDPTPAVIRNSAYYTPHYLAQAASQPPAPSLRVATERCLSQLPGLTTATSTQNSIIPADLLPTEGAGPLGDCGRPLKHSVRRISGPATSIPNQAPPALEAEADIKDKRGHVLCELMSTEEAYVSDLKVLVA